MSSPTSPIKKLEDSFLNLSMDSSEINTSTDEIRVIGREKIHLKFNETPSIIPTLFLNKISNIKDLTKNRFIRFSRT